jgi:hypothetical protein
MICAFTSSRTSRKWHAFTVPAVPTGMNIGVSIGPWSVLSNPARALLFGSLAAIVKFIVVILRKNSDLLNCLLFNRLIVEEKSAEL